MHYIQIMQPKKAPILKHIAEKQSEEGVTAHKLNPEDGGQKATANEPEVIVYVPSCKRAFYFALLSVSILEHVYYCSVPGSAHV